MTLVDHQGVWEARGDAGPEPMGEGGGRENECGCGAKNLRVRGVDDTVKKVDVRSYWGRRRFREGVEGSGDPTDRGDPGF